MELIEKKLQSERKLIMYEEIFTLLRKNCKHPERILTLKLNRVERLVLCSSM